MSDLMRLKDVWKSYNLGDTVVDALRGINANIEAGRFTVLLGPSGSGKSTVLHMLGAMDRPTRGAVHFEGLDLAKFSAREQTAFRLRRLGFIFQTFNLMPTLNALDNVALPMRLAGVSRSERQRRAHVLLDRIGLGDRAGHLPRQLSGGQRQRVAIARALANDPPLILADEPTGNLDTDSGTQVIELLLALRREGRTVVMVTHNAEYASLADRVLRLRDGRIDHDVQAAGD